MRGTIYLAAALLSACEYLPERVRETPELSGHLTQAGAAVAGATVTVQALDEDALGAPDCRDGRDAITDSAGAFTIGAHTRMALRRDSMETAGNAGRGRFFLCIRQPASQEFKVAYRAPMGLWDTLDLACDLQRQWLAADRNGAEGQCVARRMGVDGQPLAGRPDLSPALTCDTTTTLIEPLRLGPIRINGRIPELRRLCPQLRDTMVREEDLLYGHGNRMASVLEIAGVPVIIHRASGVIYQIVVESPKFRTADSLGPGVSVRRMLDKPALSVVVAGQNQGPYVLAWHGTGCGLGYSLTRPTYDSRDRIGVPIPIERLRVWPASTSIRRVIIGFCPDREVGAPPG